MKERECRSAEPRVPTRCRYESDSYEEASVSSEYKRVYKKERDEGCWSHPLSVCPLATLLQMSGIKGLRPTPRLEPAQQKNELIQ